MKKILISLPDHVAARLQTLIAARQRSAIITHLIEDEIARREKKLRDCALAVEKDEALHKEMAEWDITLQDGLTNESW